MEDQEPMMEAPPTEGSKSSPVSLSPCGRISVDENTTALYPDNNGTNSSPNVDFTQHQAKTEKGHSDEGFCCIMSMHDGVVL